MVPGVNDMATTHPELAAECLDDPTLFLAGTNKKLRWRCPRGHEYESPGVRRVRGTGCPYCSNREVLAGFNDLATIRPDLATELDGDPTTVMATSTSKADWACPLGHKYEMSVKRRVDGGGCPYCSNQQVLVGFNDMATTYPTLAAECLDDPTLFTAGTSKTLRWICPNNHEYECRGAARVQGVGCGICAGKIIVPGVNDMATTRPDLAAECLDDPTKYAAQSNKTVRWRCGRAGHEWEAKISNRANGRGCPVCGRKKIIPGVNDLITTHPEIAAQANGWDPTQIGFGHDKPLEWRCELGHEWTAPTYNRTKGTGCPYCKNRALQVGYNDLATTHPEIAAEVLDPEVARSVVAGSSNLIKWRCAEGHVYERTPNERTSPSAGYGCYYCSGKRALAGHNDVATLHPELVKETTADLTQYRPGTDTILTWRCELGHEYERSVYERTSGQACPYCSNHRVLVGFNDMATTHPELAAECLDDPTAFIAGTSTPLRWRCEQGHEWTVPGAYRRAGTGCPYCTAHGYNLADPGWLYLLRHETRGLLQFGITNHPDQRLNKHGKGGWEVIDVRGPSDGALTWEWEQSFKRLLASRAVATGANVGGDKFDGYTEAWRETDLPVTSIRELMNHVEELEEEAN